MVEYFYQHLVEELSEIKLEYMGVAFYQRHPKLTQFRQLHRSTSRKFDHKSLKLALDYGI